MNQQRDERMDIGEERSSIETLQVRTSNFGRIYRLKLCNLLVEVGNVLLDYEGQLLNLNGLVIEYRLLPVIIIKVLHSK